MTPIVCVGETLDEREADRTEEVVGSSGPRVAGRYQRRDARRHRRRLRAHLGDRHRQDRSVIRRQRRHRVHTQDDRRDRRPPDRGRDPDPIRRQRQRRQHRRDHGRARDRRRARRRREPRRRGLRAHRSLPRLADRGPRPNYRAISRVRPAVYQYSGALGPHVQARIPPGRRGTALLGRFGPQWYSRPRFPVGREGSW